MRGLILIAAVALTGCNDVPHAWSRSDIEDIAQDAAEDVRPDNTALLARIDDLETEVRDLRSDLAENASLDARGTSYSNAEFERLQKNEKVVFDNIDYLRGRFGLGPVPTTK